MNPKVIFAAVRKSAPSILSGMAVGGTVLTGILAHKAGRKYDPDKKLKEQWKNYISTGIAAAGTIACIVGANCMHLSIESAMAGAIAFYKAGKDDLEQFEDHVYEEFGDAGLRENLRHKDDPPVADVKIKIWEPYTKQWFEATQQEILWAELTANKMMQQRGKVTLNDVLRLYSDPHIKIKKQGDTLGWSWDDDMFNELSGYYYAGGWIDMCPQFEDYGGKPRFVMDYGINPNDISDL